MKSTLAVQTKTTVRNIGSASRRAKEAIQPVYLHTRHSGRENKHTGVDKPSKTTVPGPLFN